MNGNPGTRLRTSSGKTVIFDLDNCLSAADEVGKELYRPALEAIRSANSGALSEMALERAFSDIWHHALDWVARTHRFTPEMVAAGWAEFARLQITRPMKGYPDLPVLGTIPARRFLVTSGFRRLQTSKIRALGIQDLFVTVYVDAIDEPDRKGKAGIFEAILAEHRLSVRDALVVGDNPESEIKAGNSLGMETVQILRPGVPRGTNATHYVHGLAEVRDLVNSIW